MTSGMQTGTKYGISISLHWVYVTALVYLAIHAILFFGCWFSPWAACPVNLGIIISIAVFAWKRREKSCWILGKAECLGLLLAAALCMLSLVYAGMLGYIFPHPDILIFREALFQNLVHAPWPLVLPDGKEMSYYLAGVLPAAILARLAEDYTIQHIIAACWYALGLWLTLLVIFCRHGRFSWLFLLFIFFLKDPAYIIINSFAGNGDIWQLMGKWLSLPENHYIGAKSSVFNLMGSGQTCHFIPCTILAAALVLYSDSSKKLLLPLTVALLIPISPLGAIGVLPLAAVRWLTGSLFCSKAKWCGLLVPLSIVFLCAYYYLRAESATCLGLHGQLQQNWEYFLTSDYPCTALCGVLWLLVLLPLIRKEKLLLVSLVCFLLVPWIYFGSTPDSGVFGNNELWLKSGIIYHMHFLSALCFNWKKLPFLKYIFLVVTLLLTAYNLYQMKIRLTGSPIVPDVWNGHLHHQHPSLYQKLPNCKPTFIPGLLQPGGASEQHLPWSLLPKANGCDYTRPARPDGVHIRF